MLLFPCQVIPWSYCLRFRLLNFSIPGPLSHTIVVFLPNFSSFSEKKNFLVNFFSLFLELVGPTLSRNSGKVQRPLKFSKPTQ